MTLISTPSPQPVASLFVSTNQDIVGVQSISLSLHRIEVGCVAVKGVIEGCEGRAQRPFAGKKDFDAAHTLPAWALTQTHRPLLPFSKDDNVLVLIWCPSGAPPTMGFARLQSRRQLARAARCPSAHARTCERGGSRRSNFAERMGRLLPARADSLRALSRQAEELCAENAREGTSRHIPHTCSPPSCTLVLPKTARCPIAHTLERESPERQPPPA